MKEIKNVPQMFILKCTMAVIASATWADLPLTWQYYQSDPAAYTRLSLLMISNLIYMYNGNNIHKDYLNNVYKIFLLTDDVMWGLIKSYFLFLKEDITP